MTDTTTTPSEPPKPLGLASTDQLGAVFTEAIFRAAMMTELQAMRAARRYCPKCQEQKLKHTGAGGMGMVFLLCAGCGTTVVMSA